MKKLTLLLIFVLLFAALMLPCSATSYRVAIRDDLGIFRGAEILATNDGYDVGDTAFYLWTKSSYSDTDWPSDTTVRTKCAIAEGESAVALVIRRTGAGTYYYDIYTFGAANRIFSQSDVDRILDDSTVYTALKGGNALRGADRFFSLCAGVLHDHAKAEAARAKRAPLMAALIGLATGAVVGGGSVLGVWLYYRKKLHGTIYPLDRYAKLALTQREDRFVGRSVTRVRVQSSNGGSGRSGGGGGRRGGR